MLYSLSKSVQWGEGPGESHNNEGLAGNQWETETPSETRTASGERKTMQQPQWEKNMKEG